MGVTPPHRSPYDDLPTKAEQYPRGTSAERWHEIETHLVEIRRLCDVGTQAHGDEFYSQILERIDTIDMIEGIDTTNGGNPHE